LGQSQQQKEQTQQEEDFKLRPESLEAAITERTKLLVLNSPSNPTGAVYEKSELEALAEVIERHDFFVVSDEIYEKLLFEDAVFSSIAQLSEKLKSKTLVLNGVSKTYAMTGWRIGYVAGPRDLIAAMTKIQSQSTSNPTSIAQKAAVAALSGPQAFVAQMLEAFDERRKHLVQRLNAMDGVHCNVPKGAFYAFPNVSHFFGATVEGQTVQGSTELCEFLLTEARVAIVPGEAFGSDPFMRISYATGLETIEAGLERMEEALGKLG
jgi:aspartate aminotransferase